MANHAQLLKQLLAAQDENEVALIVKNHPILANDSRWTPFGENRMNFNTIDNQQQNPIAALTEKITNSIDALLLNECKVAGIDPESDSAPSTMQEAVGKFFEIPRGDFSEIMDSKRRELAKKIIIIAEGSREKPNLIVVDRGEGQHPFDFKHTFLSISKQNKINIKFVQGKYNMGGTGVLPYCGEYHYQLLLSRKNPKLLHEGYEDVWGFTLIRLKPFVEDDFKHTWYEYATDENGEPFMIEPQEIPVVSGFDNLEFGSLVKMYNYQLPPSARSDITLDLWRELNRLLFLPALPLLLYDARFQKGHVGSGKVLLGNKVRIMLDEREKVEKDGRFTVNDVDFGKFGLLNIEVTVFKPDSLVSRDEFTSDKEAVILTINGQTHGSLSRLFLKNEVGLTYLSKTMLVNVDCTGVNPAVRDQVFMPSRDRMRDNETKRQIETVLAKELRDHEGLKILNKIRQEQIWSKSPRDTKYIEEFVSDLLKEDKTLKDILGLTGTIKDITEPGPTKTIDFEGKRFPTFLHVKDKNIKDNGVKEIPINSFVRVEFETDAANDYFDREEDAGELIITPSISRSKKLWNGRLSMKLVPADNAVEGQKQTVTVELTVPYSNSIILNFEIIYGKPIVPQVNPPGPQNPPQSISYQLPKRTLVWRESWDNIGWSGSNISEVVETRLPNQTEKKNKSIISEVQINADSDVLHHFLRTNQIGSVKQEAIKSTYQTAVFLYSLVIFNDLKGINRGDLFPVFMSSVAKILLNLIFSKKLLKEIDNT
jgi:hypothetical protein